MTKPELLITPETKVGELLAAYPELEKDLFQLSPAFSKLKNPVLRKTIGRIATLRQAALAGNIPVEKLVNALRKAAGMGLTEESAGSEFFTKDNHGWPSDMKIRKSLDARPIINNGESPMAMILKMTGELEKGEALELITSFLPAPILDMLREKEFKILTRKEESELYRTYILK